MKEKDNMKERYMELKKNGNWKKEVSDEKVVRKKNYGMKEWGKE